MSTQGLCDRTNVNSSINPNGPVVINEAERQSRLSQHQADLQNLEEILPNELWPIVEALTTPFSCYKAYQLYPGRVLIGHIEDKPIWAYLWKCNIAGGTGTRLEYFVGDTDDNVKAEEDFTSMVFQKWCCLLSCKKNAIGSPSWEGRVKTMVKLTMLRAGQYDGSIPLINMVLSALKSNRQLTKSASIIESEMLHYEQESEDVVMDSSATLGTTRNGGAKQNGEAGKKPRGCNYKRLVEKLREILPSESWFRVESCQMLPQYFYEGKVLIGNFRQSEGLASSQGSIWAKVQRRRTGQKRSSRVAYFDDEDKKYFCGEGNIDPDQFDFNTPFQLLVTKDSNDVGQPGFRTRLNACVRAALLDYHPEIGDEFNSSNFKLSNIIGTIQQNIQQQTKNTLPSSQETPKETSPNLPSFSEGDGMPGMESSLMQVTSNFSSAPSSTVTPTHHETTNSQSPHIVPTGSPDSRETTAEDVTNMAHSSNAQATNEAEQSGVSSSKNSKRRLDSGIDVDLVTLSPTVSSQSGAHDAEHHKRRKVATSPMLKQSTIQTLFEEPPPAPNSDMNAPQERMITQDEVIVSLKNEVADLEEVCETLQTRLKVRNDEMIRVAHESNERIQDLMVEIHRLRKGRNGSPRMSPVETHKETSNQNELIQQLRADIDRLKDDSKKQIERVRVEVNGEKGILETRHVNDTESIKHLKSMNFPLMEYMDTHLEQVRSWLLQWKAEELEHRGNQDPEGDAKLWFGETFWYLVD